MQLARQCPDCHASLLHAANKCACGWGINKPIADIKILTQHNCEFVEREEGICRSTNGVRVAYYEKGTNRRVYWCEKHFLENNASWKRDAIEKGIEEAREECKQRGITPRELYLERVKKLNWKMP